VTDKIIYEQPLNERIRTLLRLEELMQRCRYFLDGHSRWDTHGALMTMLELVELVNRGDLKSDLMKELERQNANLSRLSEKAEVDQPRLEQIIEQQRQAIKHLRHLSGQPDQELRYNEFFNSIKKRMTIPGGSCDFDLPAYHYWLSREPEQRIAQLQAWIHPFEQVKEGADLVLELIRNSAPPLPKAAERGFYQQSLDVETPYQLIRVWLPGEVTWHPEISAGKHRFSVRFLALEDLAARPTQVHEDVAFELACCAL